jgi:GT2 family glycosyltransferase
MIDALVICTRNRPDDLRRCLNSVRLLSQQPTYILVVDQSSDEVSKGVVDQFLQHKDEASLLYLRSHERGLVRSRNLALESIPNGTQLVHFIDDDTELLPDYINALREALTKHTGVVGAAGQVIGTGPKQVDPLLKLIGMDGDKLGAVLKTGVNIGAFDHPEMIHLDWLPGCCMSFAVGSLQGLRFDEKRSVWALGEDVDFSLRVGQRGLLVHVPDAKLFHHLSPTNRDRAIDLITQDVLNRWALAKDNLGKVSRIHVFVSSVMLALIFSFASVKSWDRSLLCQSSAVLRGLKMAVFSGGFPKNFPHKEELT